MCELCKNKGWILTFNINMLQWTIEKCDDCNIFPNDEAAGEQANAELVQQSSDDPRNKRADT